jgi:transcriptional regulator with XRE-family HTH domain
MAQPDQRDMRRRFSENLRGLRAKRELTQEQLAFRTGIHRTQISIYENGQRLPNFESLIRLSGALGASTADLTAGIEFEPITAVGGAIHVGVGASADAMPPPPRE